MTSSHTDNQRISGHAARMQLPVFLAMAVVALASMPTFAAERFWATPSGGEWYAQLNWSTSPIALPPATVPGLGDVAIFGLGASSYTLTFADVVDVESVKVPSDFVTFDLQGRSLTTTQLMHIGTVFNDIGSLTLRDGVVRSPVLFVGFSSGDGRLFVEDDVTLFVDGSLNPIAATFGIGGVPNLTGGVGSMEVSGAVHALATDSYVGGRLRGVGTATVNGGLWTTDGSLIIGDDGGQGSVVIENGGTVASGALTYVGKSGRTNDFVDVVGTGDLSITNGLLATLGAATIGSADNSFGQADIVGANSTWNIVGSLFVAEQGIGNLHVRNEASVHVQTDSFISVGTNEGLLNVTTFGSLLNDGDLYVGGSSSTAGGPGHLLVQSDGTVDVGGLLKVWPTGTFTINDGAVTTNSLMIQPGATVNFDSGSLTIDGGAFNVPVSFQFGGFDPFDPPILSLVNGVSASVVDFVLGGTPGTFSTFELTNSIIDASDDINIGGDDTQAQGGGSLNLTGSDAFADDRLKIWNQGSMSIANSDVFVHQMDITGGQFSMSGGGSSLLVDASGNFGPITGIHIGTSTTFTHATINQGGSFSAPGIAFNVGSSSGSDAQFEVFDAGSSLSVGTAIIASGGSGTLVVQNQATSLFGGNLTLARVPGVFGTLLVDGPGSSMTCNGDMTIAREGFAIAQVSAGGSAHTIGDTFIASMDGSGALALLVSGGANWTSDGSIYVGGDDFAQHGSGELNIRSGAIMDNAGTLRVWPTGTLKMEGGLLQTRDLLADGGGTLDLQGGTIRVDGGQYRHASSLTFGGVDPANPVNFEFLNGADAQVQFAWHVGAAAATFGETTVSGVSTGGVRSSLFGTGRGGGADLVVGRDGTGTMQVLDGGVADFGDDIIIGHRAGSVGRLDVGGVAGGFRSTVLATRGTSAPDIFVGAAGNGRLDVFDGGLVENGRHLFIGSGVGSIGNLRIFGRNGLVGEVRVGDDLFLAGNSTAAGGRAEILMSGGLLVVNDVLKVWPDGFVDMDEGTLRVGHLDLSDARAFFFNFLFGRVEANQISGNFFNLSGTLAPGAGTIAAMTLNGDYEQFSTAELEIEMNGPTPGTEHDVANVTGTATLDGTLHVIVDPGFTPAAGQAFTVMTFASRVGQFSGVTVDGSIEFDLVHNATSVQLVVAGPSCPGDLTGDDQVDLADLVIQLSNFATPSGATYEDGDLDGDGDVDLADLAQMLSLFGTVC